MLLHTRCDNHRNQIEGCWPEIFQLLIKTRKATGFMFLLLNCREINQATPKYRMDFFSQNLQKRVNRASEYHHQILHIRNILGIKFQIELTILSFWTKLTQKRYFRSKTEEVNFTIELCIFGLG